MTYVRKTVDEWEVQSYYEGEWSLETTLTTRKEARQELKNYQQSCPTMTFRIKKLRVKKQEV